MSLHAIPEEIAEKYGLRSDGDIIVNLPGNKIRIPGSPIRATPLQRLPHAPVLLPQPRDDRRRLGEVDPRHVFVVHDWCAHRFRPSLF